MSSKKVLVTGGAGFIGSHVADAYLAHGDRVWVLDDLSSGREENVPDEAEFVRMAVGDAEVESLFERVHGFDIVNHHAAQIDVRKSVDDPREDARINIDGLLNVLECCRKHGTTRVVFVSSGGVVYGEPELRPTPETAPKAPLSPYGVTKLAAEYYLHYYHRVQGLDYVALRYSNVYGPRQDPHGEAGVVAIFSSRIGRGERLIVFGDGEQTRDYVYVGDVARANMTATELELPPAAGIDDRAFNVGTGRAASVNTLARLLGEGSGREVETEHAAARPGELRHSCLDAGRLTLHGWAAETALADGLLQTYEHIMESRVRV